MKIKRLLCIVMVCIFVGCMIPSAAFAVDPEVIDYGQMAGAIVYDLYGAANNTSLAYESIQPGPALTEIITLFQEAQAEVGGDPVSMTAIGTALLAAGAIGVVYDAGEAVYQLAVNLDYQSFGEFYQDFNQGWDYILEDVAGLARGVVSDLFEWPNNPTPILLYTDNVWYGQPVPVLSSALTTQQLYDQSLKVAVYTVNNQRITIGVYARADNVYFMFYGASNGASTTFASTTGSNRGYIIDSNLRESDFGIYDYRSDYGLYRSTSGNAYSNIESSIIFPTQADGLSSLSSAINDPEQSGGIFINPNPNYVGDPLQNPLEISIPDPATPMPQNQPIHIGTNIPADPELLPDSIPADPQPGIFYPIPADDPGILEQFWNDIVTDPDVEIDPNPDFDVEPEPGPGPDGSISEVFTPLLPTTLPSFDFNFSSIWHYVREWVASLRSFFTILFSVWAALPYAIVVPVYATAVIVIVLGVYKRFFG